jgi:hypothetical protein
LEREGYVPAPADGGAGGAAPRVAAARRGGRRVWSLELGAFRGEFDSVEGLLAALRKNSRERVIF